MKTHVHFIGICGKAMGAIAIALADAGHRVTGSDERVYPPMSDLLARAGIEVMAPFGSRNLPEGVDVVVTGRRLAGDNPEVQAAQEQGRRCVSFPVLLRDWFLHRSRNLVVAGGVGKTTTTAMLAWILDHEGQHPDFLVGGVPRGLEWPARLRGAAVCVIEGDEYASAADDPTPKFLYYRPETLVVTNTLDDHPDLYPDRASLLEAFGAVVGLLPIDGGLIMRDADPGTATLAAAAGCPIVTVGDGPAAAVRITDLQLTESGSSFRLRGVPFAIRSHGRMNVDNAAMAALAAERTGVSLEQGARALAGFRDVANRQEATAVGPGVLVVDKATHPVSIAALHEALRQRYPGRRLTAVIRPRATGGQHWVYQRDLPGALASFERVVVASPYEHRPPANTRWQHTPFSLDLLLEQLLARGCHAGFTSEPGLRATLREGLVRGDIVVLLLPEAHAAEAARIVTELSEPEQPVTLR